MNDFILIAGMALVTFAVRYPILALLGRIHLPEPIFRALKYVPAAVLTAYVAPNLVYQNNAINLSLSNSSLVAGLFAIVFAWRSKNLLLTIIIGMLVLWGWRWLLAMRF